MDVNKIISHFLGIIILHAFNIPLTPFGSRSKLTPKGELPLQGFWAVGYLLAL